MSENNKDINTVSEDAVTCAPKGCSAKKTSIGGQALIEGIMMKGPHKTAMAVRKSDGEIVVEVNENGSQT